MAQCSAYKRRPPFLPPEPPRPHAGSVARMLRRRMPTSRDPDQPCCDPQRAVESKRLDSHTAHSGPAEDGPARSVPREVVGPSVGSRMEKSHRLSGVLIDGSDHRALERVAGSTRERQIGRFMGATCDERYDVLDLEGQSADHF